MHMLRASIMHHMHYVLTPLKNLLHDSKLWNLTYWVAFTSVHSHTVKYVSAMGAENLLKLLARLHRTKGWSRRDEFHCMEQ